MQIQVRKLRTALALLKDCVGRESGGKGKKAQAGYGAYVTHVLLAEHQARVTDGASSTAIDMPEAGGNGEAVIFKLRDIIDVLTYVDGDLTMVLQMQGGKDSRTLVMTAGDFTATLHAACGVDEFPPFPKLDPVSSRKGAMDGDMFVGGLQQVAPYASKDAERPVLHGVGIFLGAEIHMVGADGFRLGHKKLPVTFGATTAEGKTLIFPLDQVSQLVGLWKTGARGPDINAGGSMVQRMMSRRLLKTSYDLEYLLVEFGDIRFAVQLIQGTFPSYEQLIPKDGQWEVTVQAGDLYRAVRQVKPFAQESSGIVRLAWEKARGRMKVSAYAQDSGSVTTEIVCVVTGTEEEGRIAFNVKYLEEYLVKKEGLLKISTAGASSPGVLHMGEGPEVVIMPMFVTHGDEKKAHTAEAGEEAEGTDEQGQESPAAEAEDVEGSQVPEESEALQEEPAAG